MNTNYEQTKLDIMSWYNDRANAGYDNGLDIYEIDHIIDTLYLWYKLKYPDNILDPLMEFDDYENSDKYLNHEELILKLSYKSRKFINGEYRGGQTYYSESQNKSYMKLPLYGNYDSITYLNMDYTNGEITNTSLKNAFHQNFEEKTTIDKLLDFLYEHDKEYDYDYRCLLNVVNKHEIDLELRDYIMNLIVLKILFTSSNINIGYKRAKLFIKEMNQNISGLNLNDKDLENEYNSQKLMLRRKNEY